MPGQCTPGGWDPIICGPPPNPGKVKAGDPIEGCVGSELPIRTDKDYPVRLSLCWVAVVGNKILVKESGIPGIDREAWAPPQPFKVKGGSVEVPGLGYTNTTPFEIATDKNISKPYTLNLLIVGYNEDSGRTAVYPFRITIEP